MGVSAGTQGVSDAGGFDIASDDAATAARLSQLRDAAQNIERAFADLKVGRDAVEAQAHARAQAAEIIEEAHQEARGIVNAGKIRARGLLEQAVSTVQAALGGDAEVFEQELERLRAMQQ